ncbi:MAG: NAD-dependent epimerase/dehydratase family protein, partial [Gammaproteobacteria bacterium]
NRETTVGELADRLLGVLAEAGVTEVRLVHAGARRGDMQRNFSDTSKARDMLGWQALTELDDGLRQTVDWFMHAQGA